jgi:hypothetical protein
VTDVTAKHGGKGGSRRKKVPGNLERRGDSYRIRLSVGGARHYFTVATTDRAAAEDFARRKYAELERDRERVAVGLPDAIRVSQLLTIFERDEVPTRAKGTQDAYGCQTTSQIPHVPTSEIPHPLARRVVWKHGMT